MTANDKATELIKSFMEIFGKQNRTCSDIPNTRSALSASIECAAIVIDNILKTKNFPNTLHPDMVAFQNAYWEAVKKYAEEMKPSVL